MVLELYTPTKADVPELVQLGYDGYSDDEISSLVYPIPASKEQIERSTQALLERFGSDPNHTDLAVKDSETGKIISHMEWDLIPEPKDDDWDIYKPRTCPPGWHEEFFQYSAKLAWQSKINDMGKQQYIYFQTLVTPPAYRNRGAGSMLIRALLDFQKQVNLPIYLIASPKGATLYPRFGFRETSRYELDISALSTNTARWHIGMLLPAPDPNSPARLPHTITNSANLDTQSDIDIKPLTTLSEHMAMRAIRERAFGPNELMELCFGGQVLSGTPESRASLSFTDAIADPRHKWIGVFQRSTSTLLGASHWYFADDPNVTHYPHGTGGWSPGTNVALGEAHFGLNKAHREAYMRGKKYAYLCLLIVDVGVQGRGLGGALLRYTLAEVDRLGWESWVDAMEAGLGLYQKLGWREVSRVVTDLKPFGGKGVGIDVEMVRLPKGTGNADGEREKTGEVQREDGTIDT